jgi:hypothetical protein
MEPTTESAGPPAHNSYVWEPPGSPVSIHISFDVVDGIAKEVLRAFSSVPKRGAEAGGLLLGSAEQGDRLVVRIRNFEPVPCEHRFGPSYLLSDTDKQILEAAFRSHAAPGNGEDRVIGYFRSHTRDGLALGPEDLELCRKLFSDSSNVVLLIKPFATKVSTAGFLFYENGALQKEPSQQFPFRRRDLNGGRPAYETTPEPAPGSVTAASVQVLALPEEPAFPPQPERTPTAVASSIPEPAIARAAPPDVEPQIPKAPGKRSWVLLALLTLAIGALLGWQAARTANPKPGISAPPANFSLGLSITNTDDNLRVTWDKEAPAIGASRRGLLEITDGDYQKAVPLDSIQLENGNITYRHLTPTVVFRLTVFPAEKTSVEETKSWKGVDNR